MAMNFWKKPKVQTPPRKIRLDFKLDLLLQFFFVNLRRPFPMWRSFLMTFFIIQIILLIAERNKSFSWYRDVTIQSTFLRISE